MRFDRLMAISELISEEHLEPKPATSANAPTLIDSLDQEQLDSLPFGAIQLDQQGTILRFNRYESDLSRIQQSKAIGRNFFTEIAPCTNVREFHGRFLQGAARGNLCETFQYHFPFKFKPRDVMVTLFYSKTTATTWVFIRPA
jgi:photoactive yellow protein